MDGNAMATVAGLFGVSVVASLLVLWVIGKWVSPPRKPVTEATLGPVLTNTILLRYGLVTDHDCTGADFIAKLEDWTDLRRWLDGRFEGLPDFLPDDAEFDATFPSRSTSDDPATIAINSTAGQARLTLSDPVPSMPVDRQQALFLQLALAEDHTALQKAPFAIWKTDKEGAITWENDTCAQTVGPQLDAILEGYNVPKTAGDTSKTRIAVQQPHGKLKTWFDIHSVASEHFNIFYASDVTNAVNAEAAQREFVQTLTKTFANLTTGLAIFDINQQLALFNPALVDLTALPAEFLSGRPSLMSFFDNLRDRQVMPEPKSYSNWRAQINEMIQTAADGLYQETWSLPSGGTYRVTGRPHPNGAVAFLFEDISAEISLTRRFRAQSDLRQSVMDRLDHAVAVIASNNVVIFCNATWTQMFGVDPDTSFAELGIRDLVAICRQKYPHPDFWKSVETQLTCKTLTHAISQIIETETDGTLQCRLEPVSGGAALICLPLAPVKKFDIPEPAIN